MKVKSVIKTLFLFAIIFATVTVSAQVERDPNTKQGGKRDGAVKDKEASMERIKTKIESQNKVMANMMISHNINQIVKLYTTDAILLPNNGVKISGKAAIKKSWESAEKSGVKFTEIKFITQSVEKAGAYFYEIGEYQMLMDIPGVPEKVSDIGKYLTIWEKKGQELLIKVEIYNSNVDPMAKKMDKGGDKVPPGKPEKDSRKNN